MKFTRMACGSIVCLISTIVMITIATAQQPDADTALAAAGQAATANFRASTAADVASPRAEASDAARQLDERLAIAGESGRGWKEYLRWDEFKDQFRHADDFSAMEKRLSEGYGGLARPPFADLRRALLH